MDSPVVLRVLLDNTKISQDELHVQIAQLVHFLMEKLA
jgi:hypothetical protein